VQDYFQSPASDRIAFALWGPAENQRCNAALRRIDSAAEIGRDAGKDFFPDRSLQLQIENLDAQIAKIVESRPARIERLDLSTSKRVLFKELAPPSRAGVLDVR
jgi:hypothetical protein